MGKKLYVGNLPYSTTDDSLREMFTQFGTVESAQIITDQFSGRSKGFGFVEMASDEEAQNAVKTLDGKDIEGRAIKVNEARPKTDRPRREGGGGGYGGGGGRGGRGGGGGGGGRDRGRGW